MLPLEVLLVLALLSAACSRRVLLPLRGGTTTPAGGATIAETSSWLLPQQLSAGHNSNSSAQSLILARSSPHLQSDGAWLGGSARLSGRFSQALDFK